MFPLFPSRCVSPLLSLTGAPRGSWSCYPCAKTSGMFTLQRGDTPGKGWKMRNVMFMVGKWKKMEKVFVAFLHLEVLILYILDMFWYVYFKYVLQCLAYVFISFATFFFWIIFLDNVLNVLCAWFPSSWMRCKDLQRLCLATLLMSFFESYFHPFFLLAAPQVTCHQASPLQTIYGRWIPKRPERLDNINLPCCYVQEINAHILERTPH